MYVILTNVLCYGHLKINMELYRSGHNEPHSKCGSPPGLVGSNPTNSANENPVTKQVCRIFMYVRLFVFKKTQKKRGDKRCTNLNTM